MKTLFSSRELPHLWAHQTYPAGRSPGAMSFRGADFRSYGATIGRVETNAKGQKAYLISQCHYSMTTSGHQSSMQAAIPYDAVKFYVPVIWNDHRRVLDGWTSEIKAKLVDANKSREPKKSRLMGESAGTLAEMHRFAEFFGVKKFAYPVVPGSKAELADAIAKQERAELRKQAAAERTRQKELEKRRVEYSEERERWLMGEPIHAWRFSGLFGTDLRIVGDEVETSRGARVPVKDAKRALKLVDKVRATGKEWHRNGAQCHVGHYSLDSISPEGNIVAGCHTIPYAAIERIAPQLMEVK